MKLINYSTDLGITNSLIGAWSDCRQQAEFYLQTWDRKVGKDALHLGSFFHDLLDTVNLEIFSNHRVTNAVLDLVIDERAEVLINDFCRKSTNPNALQEIEDNAYTAIMMIKEYCRYYRTEDTKKYNLVSSEQEFDIEWEGYRWRGKIDGLLEVKKTKKKVFKETKTFSKLNEVEKADLLEFDFQTLMYRHFAELIMKTDVDSVIYDMVRKPQIKQRKSETRDEFLIRCRNDMKDRPDFYFIRFNVTFDPLHIEQHRKELLSKAKEFELWTKGEIDTYKNERACKKMWACNYLKMCSSNSKFGYHQTGLIFNELDEPELLDAQKIKEIEDASKPDRTTSKKKKKSIKVRLKTKGRKFKKSSGPSRIKKRTK